MAGMWSSSVLLASPPRAKKDDPLLLVNFQACSVENATLDVLSKGKAIIARSQVLCGPAESPDRRKARADEAGE